MIFHFIYIKLLNICWPQTLVLVVGYVFHSWTAVRVPSVCESVSTGSNRRFCNPVHIEYEL